MARAFVFSPRRAPEFCNDLVPPENRGRREDRVRAAPAVSCAICTEKCAHEHTGSAETLRPSPRNGFTAYSVLSLVTGFLATIALRDLPQNLTPASGRQNHTTSPSASVPFVKSTSESTASHRNVRDDREPPLLSGETRRVKPVICPTTEAEYFSREDWTTQITLIGIGNLRFSRTAPTSRERTFPQAKTSCYSVFERSGYR